jgi:2,3-bisphosphoglycerate-independent phosphoglycerate mutase
MAKPVVLIVFDGWGIGDENDANPLRSAKLPNIDWLKKNMPVTSLEASGISVGLPWGETGNSEVGHLTMGAGKVIYQHYPRITLAIQDKTFFSNAVLKGVFDHARTHKGRVHFVGLLSEGNTHASVEQLESLVSMAADEKMPDFFLHLFGDGKDAAPFMIKKLLDRIPRERIATLIGRHYAMDREENWQLTKTAYELIMGIGGAAVKPGDLDAAIVEYTKDGLSEEFLPAMRIRDDGTPRDGDAIFFFNFREDSIRQLTEAFIVPAFQRFPLVPLQNTTIATMTRYEDRFSVPVAFPPDEVMCPLGKAVSDTDKTQLRVAESYKYAHVTYFFNGYREAPYKNEYRVLIPSLQSTHPDEHPEMQAQAITDRLVEGIENRSFDFILVNYANADTIGHTGNYNAAIKAAEMLDTQLGRILPAAQRGDVTVLLTGDHGNIERMYNPQTGRPETQHDPNPVPLYLIGTEFTGRQFPNAGRLRNETGGTLADIAPTILSLMNIPVPDEMTGQDMVKALV